MVQNKRASKPSAKSTANRPPPKPQPTTAPNTQLRQHQQRLLDIFAAALHPILSSDELPSLLQEVKQALYRRDFATAFGSPRLLEVYAARWSPTRALCYADVLLGLRGYIERLQAAVQSGEPAGGDGSGEDSRGAASQVEGSQDLSPTPIPPPTTAPPIRMLAIGGCAAEHIALASYLHQTTTSGILTLLDAAPWSSTSALLETHLTTPPKHASASPFLTPSQLTLHTARHDILSLDASTWTTLIGDAPLLVTLLFTLNELYTRSGIGPTTAFLARLGSLLPRGSLLLVVDSPGSYSEAAVGNASRRYPMQWLLDMALLGTAGEDDVVQRDVEWEKLETRDSAWFRLPEGLSYPIPLENMRYQMHLYRVQ